MLLCSSTLREPELLVSREYPSVDMLYASTEHLSVKCVFATYFPIPYFSWLRISDHRNHTITNRIKVCIAIQPSKTQCPSRVEHWKLVPFVKPPIVCIPTRPRQIRAGFCIRLSRFMERKQRFIIPIQLVQPIACYYTTVYVSRRRLLR